MIAKYFANALREDTLLHRCRGGIVFFPGQAGTVQEIFQAATENFYAAGPTLVAPMILVGVDYWTTSCRPGRCCTAGRRPGYGPGHPLRRRRAQRAAGCSPTLAGCRQPAHSFLHRLDPGPSQPGPGRSDASTDPTRPVYAPVGPEGEANATTKTTVVAVAAGVLALGAGIGIAGLASADPTPTPTPSATASGAPTPGADRPGRGGHTAARTTRNSPRNWPASSG